MPSYSYAITLQTPTGYVDEVREITGPLYHGGRPNRSGRIVPGRRPNEWGDGRRDVVYFTTSLDTARDYAARCRGGRVYEVEPTGAFSVDHHEADFKTAAPLAILAEVD